MKVENAKRAMKCEYDTSVSMVTEYDHEKVDEWWRLNRVLDGITTAFIYDMDDFGDESWRELSAEHTAIMRKFEKDVMGW